MGEQGIAIMALAGSMILLVVLLLLRSRKKNEWPYADRNATAKRVQNDARELLSELDRTTDRVDKQIQDGLRQLHQLLEEIRREKRQSPSDASCDTSPPVSAASDNDTSRDSTESTSGQERIHQLAADGLSSVEIARKLDRPVGEVELVLSLRKAGASER